MDVLKNVDLSAIVKSIDITKNLSKLVSNFKIQDIGILNKGAGETNVYHINGDISLPSVKDRSDAEGLFEGIKLLALQR
jgi:hypothetical protein